MEEFYYHLLVRGLTVIGFFGIGCIILFLKDISIRQLGKDVKAEVKYFRDLVLPFIIVISVNLIQCIIDAIKNINKPWINYAKHSGFEFLIVIITYFFIIFFEFGKRRNELKHEFGSFWKKLQSKLNTIDKSIFGIHTTDFRRMFEPTGLKYFQTTVTCFKKNKNLLPFIKFHRILLIHDNLQENVHDSWAENIINKQNELSKFEKQFQLYIQLHKENQIELHLITQKKLHQFLTDLKKDSKFSALEKAKLNQVSPCNLKSNKIILNQLDCLIINEVPYNTSPAKGLNFMAVDSFSRVTSKLITNILDDNEHIVHINSYL